MNKRSRKEWQVLHLRDLLMTGHDFQLKVLGCTIKPWSTFSALTARVQGKETCAMWHEGGHSVPWPDKEAMTTSSL